MKRSVQEVFLKMLGESKSLVAVYLKHGIKLKGRVVGHDEKSILLECADGIEQLVLIDAVSTVMPIFDQKPEINA